MTQTFEQRNDPQRTSPPRRMTIGEIKERTKETNPYYFSRETLKFFNQKMSSFSVTKRRQKGIDGYLISAPSRWDGRLMGYSRRFFNPITNDLEDVEGAD